MRMALFCEASNNLVAGLIQPNVILHSEAFGLTTETRPQTAGCAVTQFMSAWGAGYLKHRENREKLHREQLIVCRGVKLFSVKDVTITTVTTGTVTTVTITNVTV